MTDNRDPKDHAAEIAQAEDAEAVEVDATLAEADTDGDSLRDSVGAYLLDALSEDERVAFESFLATSPETQAELRQLAPVVTLLPRLLELERPGEAAAPAPTAALRDRILTEAAAVRPTAAAPADQVEAADAAEPMEQIAEVAADDPESTSAAARSRTIRTAPEGTGPFDHKRRPRQTPTGAPSPRATPRPLQTLGQFPPSWLLAAGLTIVAIGAIFWALALQGRIDSKNREIGAQKERLVSQDAEIANLRGNANATAFTLSSTSDQAADAGGTLLFSLRDQIGVLYVRNLPPLDDQRVYQLWYLDDQADAPLPGGTFQVDRNGNGFIVVEADTPTFDGIALTEEPEGGSESPTSEIVLQGNLGGAAG